MDLLKEIYDRMGEIANEIKLLNSSLHLLGNNTKAEYLTFAEIMDQYPVSRETLYRLKDADILQVSRMTQRGKFLVERKHFENVIKSNNV